MFMEECMGVCGLKINLGAHYFLCWADGVEIHCCVQEIDVLLIYCMCNCNGWVMIVEGVDKFLKML